MLIDLTRLGLVFQSISREASVYRYHVGVALLNTSFHCRCCFERKKMKKQRRRSLILVRSANFVNCLYVFGSMTARVSSALHPRRASLRAAKE